MTISWRVWAETQQWLLVIALMVVMVMETAALSGPNVCMVKQKYNITKRIKYRAPMSIRTYEWCFSMPPRCSRWNTEMRDLTRLETEERTAEVAVCCPGYKMKDVSCVPICPNGKTGSGCTEDCPTNKWGPNCVHECKGCFHGVCSPITGECICQEGWQGESCEIITSTSTTSTTPVENLLTSSNAATKTTRPTSSEPTLVTTLKSNVPITTGSTMSTTIAKRTLLPTTQKTETTAPLTTSTKSLDQFSLSTSPTTLLRYSNSYKDAIPNSIEKQTVTRTNETVKMKSKDILYTSTVKTLETSKSYNAANTTTTRVEMKPVTLRSADKKEIKSVAESFPTDETTSRVFEITKSLPSKTTPRVDTTKKPETTVKILQTTLKFKPKEIWIRPAQKGELPVIETKTKINHDSTHIKYKNATKIEIIPNTTPKTIIVSIIPTSVSYATFKKIAFTTASYMSLKNQTFLTTNKLGDESTKAMSAQTATAIPIIIPKTNTTLNNVILTSMPKYSNTSKPISHTTLATSRRTSAGNSMIVNNTTNSMSSTSNVVVPKLNSSNHLTTTPVFMTNITSYPQKETVIGTEKLSTSSFNTTSSTETSSIFTTEHTIKVFSTNKNVETMKPNATKTIPDKAFRTKFTNQPSNRNLTNTLNITKDSETNTITDKPEEDEEKFHILTEPEHITAVMSEKETERSSVDLISVLSIAGGVMMAVITVAVIIVMMERCKRPRYDDIRKINDIRMQVMIDNNDIPPPYVRSIFHTPLPDPPSTEKCHYQPISTLDRNLKQFMRPVVVQTISPIMLENFRGILECHYDHLPQRSLDFGTMQKRSSVTPPNDASEQQLLRRVSLTESAIDALKCEAKLDVIDSTTSEPLYAEIPCWRPPSEHAVEIINMNGEAVTEL